MSAPLVPRVVRSLADVPAAAWDALLDPRAVPFLEHAWLAAFEETGVVGPRTGWSPRHLTVWRGGRLVGAAPAYVRRDSFGEFVWDFAWADAAQRMGVDYYPKLTLAVPFTPATGTRLLAHPAEDRAAVEKALADLALETAREEGLSSVHVLFPTDEQAERLVSFGLAHRLHAQFHWRNAGYATWDDFLARFASKQRGNIRRERAAAGKQGVAVRTIRGEGLASVDPALVHSLYASTVDKHMWGRRHLKPRFFERVLQTMRHRVEVVLAEREGRVVAGAFNVGSPTHLYGRYWGCFEELPFLHFHVALYHSIEESIRMGRQVFEGGAGGEHKLTRGFEPVLTHSAHFIAHRGLDQAIRRYLAGEREATLASVAGYRSSTGLKAAGGA